MFECRKCEDKHDDIQEMSDPQGDGNLICLECLDKELSNHITLHEKILKLMETFPLESKIIYEVGDIPGEVLGYLAIYRAKF